LETGTQFFHFNLASATFTEVRPRQADGSLRPLGLLKNGRLCFQASTNGAAVPDLHLEAYDGDRFVPFKLPPPDSSPGDTLSTLFAAQNGDLWISGDRGTAWYHEQRWRTFTSTDGSTPESVVAFAESADGKIWCATQDKVWAFSGRDWSAVRVGFDRVNALIAARDGSLWVGTESGLYRFFQGAWSRMAPTRASLAGPSASFTRMSAAASGSAPRTV
jgi:ligand-binding sensor domain-containing protein